MKQNEMYEVIKRNDETYDGSFFYGVKSTMIFCKPSCKSKTPLPHNTVFFSTKEDAYENGFRACKRCRSDLETFDPLKELAIQTKHVIDNNFRNSYELSSLLTELGFSSHRLTAIFKQYYEKTISGYLQEIRLKEAKKIMIMSDDKISDIVFDVGFDSLSTFYRIFKASEGISPSEYRRKNINFKTNIFETKFGNIKIEYKNNVLYKLNFCDEACTIETSDLFVEKVIRELNEYFNGLRDVFTFKYILTGTEFKRKVWTEVTNIPYGETKSYTDIAKDIGKPKASRAVGSAISKNPILIIVPCHRVISSNGTINGYAGGIEKKKELLIHESINRK